MEKRPLNVRYFDGLTSEPQAAVIWISGATLVVHGPTLHVELPLSQVHWPHGRDQPEPVIEIDPRGALQCESLADWVAWADANQLLGTWITRWERSIRWTLASIGLIGVLMIGFWLWGIPTAASWIVAALPKEVDQRVGSTALSYLDDGLLKPSTLSDAEQQQIASAFKDLVAKSPPSRVPAYTLVFRSSAIGPNAFAVPGDTIVLTDEMVRLVDANPKVLSGVLAHELGHVRYRHGMKNLVQSSAIASLAGLWLGDFSSILAAVPIWLAQSGYSRDAERQSDQQAAQMLVAAQVSPLVMNTLFERLRARSGSPGTSHATTEENPMGIAFSTHPADAERIEFFKQAAKNCPTCVP